MHFTKGGTVDGTLPQFLSMASWWGLQGYLQLRRYEDFKLGSKIPVSTLAMKSELRAVFPLGKDIDALGAAVAKWPGSLACGA